MHDTGSGVLVLIAAALALLLVPGCSGPEDKRQQDDTARARPAEPGADANSKPAKPQPPAPKPQDRTARKDAGNPIVVIETSQGTIRAELWKDKAPRTVANFLRYVDEEFYDGLIFHRVMAGFMIQGGGFTPDMRQKRPHGPIRNEASPDLRNDRGTLAMARTGEVHSATAQFFINHADNDFLNQRNKTAQGFGYCAFGKVIKGMDVVDAIAKTRTGNRGRYENVPIQDIVIKSVRRGR